MDLEHFRWGALQLILLIISIGLHEFGHAWVADLRGDPLPRLQGRVTLNPFAHTDLIGTIILPGIMIFLSPGFGLIGWGKPVQISLPNPKTRRMDDICITLAGPGMNLVLCLILALIGALGSFDSVQDRLVIRFLVSGIFLNSGLVVFNLIPIPPLDGSRIAVPRPLYRRDVPDARPLGLRHPAHRGEPALLPRRHGRRHPPGRHALVLALGAPCLSRSATRGLPISRPRAKVGSCKPSANASKKPVSDWA